MIDKIKFLLKRVIPDRIIAYVKGFFYGWRGDYPSWEAAKLKCDGYDSSLILERVSQATRKVMTGFAKYERDSVTFTEVDYSFPLLASLMWIAARNNGKINVLDFGGSLGSSYYQNKIFLDSLSEVNWCIVEQPNFVEIGQKSFSDDVVHFYYNIDDCIKEYKIDIILFSSVLQYLEYPYKVLENIVDKSFNFMVIDRTPFIKGPDRITVQKVPKRIYKASYPCWFFNKDKFMRTINLNYLLLYEFDAIDKANITSEFKGFLFEKRANK